MTLSDVKATARRAWGAQGWDRPVLLCDENVYDSQNLEGIDKTRVFYCKSFFCHGQLTCSTYKMKPKHLISVPFLY